MEKLCDETKMSVSTFLKILMHCMVWRDHFDLYKVTFIDATNKTSSCIK